MAVFMSYCPQFYGSRAIYSNLKKRYMFESYDQKLVVFVFYGHFHELLPTVFGFQLDLHASEEPLHVWEIWPENRSFRVFMAVFISHCPQFLGYRVIYNDLKTLYMFESYA